jgi:uncharacterized RDD family membrane protein YckC
MRTCKRTILLSLVAAVAFLGVPIGAQDAPPPPDTPGEPAPAIAPDEPTAEQPESEPAPEVPNPPAKKPVKAKHRKPRPHIQHDALIRIGENVELKAGETAEAVVVIGGSATIKGKVTDAVVAICGDVVIEGGEVGDAAVAVLGNINAGQGANIHGDVVTVGGELNIDEDSEVGGEKVQVHPAGLHLPWLRSWFLHCGLMARPLAPQVGWVWVIAGVFFLLYVLVATLFPRPVLACVNELTMRPATTFFMGFLTLLLLPLVLVILAATGIGLFVIPFAFASLFLAAIVGKVALLEWMGLKVGHQFGATQPVIKPLAALAIGAGIIALVYIIPILGLLTFGIISVWGLGGAITATFGGLRREMPAKAPTTPQSPEVAAMTAPAQGGASQTAAAIAPIAPVQGSEASAESTPAATAAAPAVLPETLSYPKAGFWERMAAALLDLVLIGICGVIVGRFTPIVALAYFSGMWAWRGTTIGGIVLGLKVVRFDGQPVTFPVALIRGLAAAFSIVVLFLGILWIAWDAEKQGWHDKIAGTVVLKLPKGTPLICL